MGSVTVNKGATFVEGSGSLTGAARLISGALNLAGGPYQSWTGLLGTAELVSTGGGTAAATFKTRLKAEGLRTNYALGDDAVSFWSHHGDVDVRHSQWAQDALDSSAPDSAVFEPSVRAAADAWWAFLDEREAARPPARSAVAVP